MSKGKGQSLAKPGPQQRVPFWRAIAQKSTPAKRQRKPRHGEGASK